MKKTDEFQARSDDGRVFTIEEWTPFHDASSQDGKATVPGIPRLRTSDGDDVNPPDASGAFEILQLGLKVTKI